MNRHSHSAIAAMRQGWSKLLMLVFLLVGTGYAHAYPSSMPGLIITRWDIADDIL